MCITGFAAGHAPRLDRSPHELLVLCEGVGVPSACRMPSLLLSIPQRVGSRLPVPCFSISSLGHSRLQEQGFQVLVLSGDSPAAVAAVAQAAGISDARSRMLPEEKAAAVEALQQQGHRVAMVSCNCEGGVCRVWPTVPHALPADVGCAAGRAARSGPFVYDCPGQYVLPFRVLAALSESGCYCAYWRSFPGWRRLK